MSITTFLKKFRQGILDLSVEQQLQAKMVFFIGGSIGMLMAAIAFLMSKSWGLSIFLFSMTGLQIVSAIGTRQQYIQTKKIMEEIKNDENKKTNI